MRKTGICSITIGITGTDEHVGVTHLSIMLANYLVSKERCRAAVVDMSLSNSFAVLQEIYQDGLYQELDKKSDRDCADFQMHKVDYYSQRRQKNIANIFQMGYEYIIIDFGKLSLHNCHSELLRCHVRILVGSCCEWQQQAFLQVLEEKQQLCDAGSWKYAAFLGIQEIRSRIEKKYHIQIHKIPFEEDPFQLHRKHFEPLKIMLQEEPGVCNRI